jgi:hypothetical protein
MKARLLVEPDQGIMVVVERWRLAPREKPSHSLS